MGAWRTRALVERVLDDAGGQFLSLAHHLRRRAPSPRRRPSRRRRHGRVYARFYNDGGCGPSPWVEDTVFVQSDTAGLAGCQDLTVGPFVSTYFDTNNFSKTGE